MRAMFALLALSLLPVPAGATPAGPEPAPVAMPGSRHSRWLARGKTYVVKPGAMVTNEIGRAYAGKPRRRGRVTGLVALESGPGFVIADPERAFGTRLAVYQLSRLMALYHARFPRDPPVIIRDLSKRHGEPLPNHVSHQEGRDVDIPVVLDPVHDVTRVKERTINAERTWFIVKELVDSCELDFIFLDASVQKQLHEHALKRGVPRDTLALILQYPSEQMTGIVVHWPNHVDHLHVRFRHEGQGLMTSAGRYCRK